ncbi:MAG TPA: endopeptidase La [Kiritimatiellia bacterium]|nr:endopeptidase La [Kiritimatiellia bacterium]HRZ13160.1 endopeptidase La [Kiritimatiellia bacterium]HSA17581.1 endopeptidase La [Kiritimatiellia bacterium]
MSDAPESSSPPPGPADPPPANGERPSPSPIPPVLPVLPMSDLVLFPSMVAPLVVNTPKSARLIDAVTAGPRLLITVLQKSRAASDDAVGFADLHEYGCVARLIKMLKFPDETVRILVQGISRCRLARPHGNPNFLEVYHAILKDEVEDSVETMALARNASQKFQEIITLSPTLPEELKIAVFNVDGPGALTDLIASHLNMSLEDRQALLEEYRVKGRLNRLTTLLNREFEVLRMGTEIQHKVSENFAKTQREFFLREQMKAIRQELGEKDQQQMEGQEIEKKIAAARLPPEALEAANKERERLLTMPSASPEYAIIRTYLDWLTELPWAVATEDALDIARARAILDRDHYDLAKVKDRILEYLSVLKLKKDLKGPILCFVGPPGVGKTSLGQSIARALGRKFVRMSLGGMRDEAEIRGHRRTYVGALPGRIIQGLRKAGSRNPVFMLDEIDKLGQDFRGDPSAALLEVLDPEQNTAFTDHYLNVPFDLSSVLFITTANLVDPLPPALHDRMETLELPGYTANEKVHIAGRYLVPKQIAAHGLKRSQLAFPRATLQRIIGDYTREAGVRNLERQIASICRKTARRVAEGRRGAKRVTPEALHGLLGPKLFEAEVAERQLEPGIATGLAWTWAGGDILFIEATRMPGRGLLTLTGSLGEVMKESAQAALSYVRANARKLGLPADVLKSTDIHIHVPSGAIPKDGPSAGIAMLSALVSLLSSRPVRAGVAMTGEITLRGKVMPVGGIKEKVLAAARAGIRKIILPARNRRSLEDVPSEVRRRVKFVLVDNADSALRAVLGPGRKAGT